VGRRGGKFGEWSTLICVDYLHTITHENVFGKDSGARAPPLCGSDTSGGPGRRLWRAGGRTAVFRCKYEITLTDGKETARKKVSSVVTRKPVTKVIAIGTKQADDGCDPNYTPCVPIASDVDCAGGSGNGPAYVDGPIRVIGSDLYDLDRDGDGIACD
jgi:hypothetical protein